jgi:hypothetical protein
MADSARTGWWHRTEVRSTQAASIERQNVRGSVPPEHDDRCVEHWLGAVRRSGNERFAAHGPLRT